MFLLNYISFDTLTIHEMILRVPVFNGFTVFDIIFFKFLIKTVVII